MSTFQEGYRSPSIYLALTILTIWFTSITCSGNINITTTKTTTEPSEMVQVGEAIFTMNYTRVTQSVNDVDETDNSTHAAEIFERGPVKFDDKAVLRGFIVFSGLVGIISVYLIIKFLWLRRKRRGRSGGELGVGVYGPLQTSEMNLLQPLEHDQSDSDDDETTHYQQLPTSLLRELDPRSIQR